MSYDDEEKHLDVRLARKLHVKIKNEEDCLVLQGALTL